ncbi:sensor domain-containing diguanylate cyclase [Ideonella paludis]|uniref:diguanylate cyclase n=1 Tax=Ideonella paludis TaxID=1233411 RepID=A0ABS5DZ71_9BURK|nr:sensor domain-containing diguanylate cyclase [Ideonella paludis]MBQ0936126.1 diguanylate cyclase [Ideonella paludis]
MALNPSLPLQALAELLPGLLSQAQVLAGVFDADDRLVWANAAFCEALAVVPGSHPTWAEMMRHCHATQRGTVINTDDFEAWLASAASRRGKLPYRQFETDLHDGRWILMTETVDERGWMLCLGSDVSDLARDHRELRVARDQAQRASLVDALTGMGNRSFVMTQLSQRLAGRLDTPLCVVMADLDHFKQINDSVGHAGGDAVLCDFARLLQQGIRRVDVCGRMGGEEFMAVLEGLSLSEAEQVMQRVLASVRASRPLASHPELSYRVSMGLAQAAPGEPAASLISRADAALYQAKRQGRDRCVLA